MQTPIDVIIVTKDRLGLLTNCLLSLAKAATGQNIRVLIGLNGSPREFESALRAFISDPEFARSFSRGCMIHRFEECLPGAARNLILKKATARWIFFSDDDITVPDSLFRDFEQMLSIHPEASVFGGPNLTPPGSPSVERAQGHVLGSPLISGPMSRRYRARLGDRPAKASDLTLCNLFVSFVKSNVDFPDTFICGEELTLLEKVSGPFYASDKLFVYHARRASWLSFVRQAFKYGVGRSSATPSVSVLAWFILLTIILVAFHFPSQAQLVLSVYLIFVLLESVRVTFHANDRSAFPATFLAALTLQAMYLVGVLAGPIARANLIASSSLRRMKGKLG